MADLRLGLSARGARGARATRRPRSARRTERLNDYLKRDRRGGPPPSPITYGCSPVPTDASNRSRLLTRNDAPASSPIFDASAKSLGYVLHEMPARGQSRKDGACRGAAAFSDVLNNAATGSRQLDLDPTKLVFIDETWASTNMATNADAVGEDEGYARAIPHGHYKTITLVAGLRLPALWRQGLRPADQRRGVEEWVEEMPRTDALKGDSWSSTTFDHKDPRLSNS